MNTVKSKIRTPWHMWVIGVFLLLFNGFATFDYLMTVMRYQPYLSAYPEDVLAYFYGAPLWMYVIWGFSMVGGLIAVIALLMRKRVAVPIYAIAWIASVIAVIYSVLNPVPGGGSVLFSVIVIIIALLVLVYFRWLQKRGVLR